MPGHNNSIIPNVQCIYRTIGFQYLFDVNENDFLFGQFPIDKTMKEQHIYFFVFTSSLAHDVSKRVLVVHTF